MKPLTVNLVPLLAGTGLVVLFLVYGFIRIAAIEAGLGRVDGRAKALEEQIIGLETNWMFLSSNPEFKRMQDGFNRLEQKVDPFQSPLGLAGLDGAHLRLDRVEAMLASLKSELEREAKDRRTHEDDRAAQHSTDARLSTAEAMIGDVEVTLKKLNNEVSLLRSKVDLYGPLAPR